MARLLFIYYVLLIISTETNGIIHSKHCVLRSSMLISPGSSMMIYAKHQLAKGPMHSLHGLIYMHIPGLGISYFCFLLHFFTYFVFPVWFRQEANRRSTGLHTKMLRGWVQIIFLSYFITTNMITCFLVCFGHNFLHTFVRELRLRRWGGPVPRDVRQMAGGETALARAFQGGDQEVGLFNICYCFIILYNIIFFLF